MNKLEVGMYVRTTFGYICKLININEFREPCFKYGVEASYLKDIMFIGDEDIKGEPSLDIIDLIEVGDYVNGYKVDELGTAYGGKIVIIKNGTLKPYLYQEDIKSIVTKEMFEQMKYEVE